jgi:YesN/AraC family two-component response regulator
MQPIRVLIADDEPLLLQALGEVIGSSPDFELVATAANAADATRLAGDLHPHVALLDVRMPEGGGIAAAEGSGRRHRPPGWSRSRRTRTRRGCRRCAAPEPSRTS